MAVSVQILSRAASEKLSMKYCDLSGLSTENDEGPEPKRLSLQEFLLSNYASSPRRRLSVDDICDNQRSPRSLVEGHRRSTESNEDKFIMSRFGAVPFHIGNSTPAGFKKTGCIGSMPRSKTFQALSSKYKLLYLCGVSNIDMVDNYVTLQR